MKKLLVCFLTILCCVERVKAEVSLAPPVQGEFEFQIKRLHEQEDWQNDAKDIPFEALKGQKKNVTEWHETESLLDFEKWRALRAKKDQWPQWEEFDRMRKFDEQLGEVISCSGSCYVHRGLKKGKVTYRSLIQEGDELETQKDSYLWILLLDGSLVRLAPQTSISFNEVNILDKEVFFFLRLQKGYFYLKPRTTKEEKFEHLLDTDQVFYPLKHLSSNMEFYQNQKGFLEMESFSLKVLYEKTNELIRKNNKWLNKKSKYLLLAPNVSMMTQGSDVHMLHLEGGHSYLKTLKNQPDSHNRFYYRGYQGQISRKLDEDKWLDISPSGKSITPYQGSDLHMLSFPVTRITSILHYRETRLKEKYQNLLKSDLVGSDFAKAFGHRKWGEEQGMHVDYLVDYHRRNETTNLFSLKKVLAEEVLLGNIVQNYYAKAMDAYLARQNTRDSLKRKSTAYMDELQLRTWILRNGK